jgi:ribonucleoside-diphosphate reductase alpha chain
VKKMSNIEHFQSDNQKYTQARTDIYNPAFECPINNGDSDFLKKDIHKYCEMISFLRWYPDIAYDLMKPKTGKKLELDADQRMTLRMLVRMPDNYLCVIRGYGKTMLHIMAHYHIARFFPNARLSVTASTRESAVSIWQSKHKELLEFYPSLADEIKYFSFAKDRGTVQFVNGSEVDALANSQQSKGQRRHRGGLEESNIIDKKTLEDAVIPIFNIPRRTSGNEIDPDELNGQINRYTTSGYKNSDEFDVIKLNLENMKNLNGAFLTGSDWILPVYYGRQKKSLVDKARQGDLTFFKMNYLCEWVGASDGALMNISRLMNARVVDKPEFECEKDKRGNLADVEYVFGVDVARSDSDSNNKSAIVVIKIIRSPNRKVRQVKLVNIVTPPNGLTFNEQSIIIKRMFYQYGGNLVNPERSKVKAIIIDANVIGQGLVDEMLRETTDPLSGEELGCFGTLNTNQIPEITSAPELIFCLKAQGINGAIITNFLNYCESGKLKLLKDFKSIKESIKQEEREQYESACLQINYLIDEVANLKIKKTKNDADITDTMVVRKIDKDRYSALAYGLYYIDVYMNNADEDMTSEEDDVIFY